MDNRLKTILIATGLLFSATSFANDIEGAIESIDQESQSLVVQGITFHATDSTDYDDGLNQFSDLQLGQVVEIDFEYKDGQHYATEIELERD
ncbi:DUF5666 domain-containing protein [uncultured Umboniibacter sp.]|uniref:DUF5666 domain-containing protein n=1 Tax=uncultured Umboniibacter sp. TaxID=1798917 RepID=UPI00261B70E2|nr:DUF5666 domain-containing protein [uncultured Umboniibacter sp.]